MSLLASLTPADFPGARNSVRSADWFRRSSCLLVYTSTRLQAVRSLPRPLRVLPCAFPSLFLSCHVLPCPLLSLVLPFVLCAHVFLSLPPCVPGFSPLLLSLLSAFLIIRQADLKISGRANKSLLTGFPQDSSLHSFDSHPHALSTRAHP